MKIKQSKKGTSIVEAAVVFPIVILVVFAIIYIMIFFYQQVETQATMHKGLRQEAGEISNTLEYQKKIRQVFSIYQKGNLLYSEDDLLFRKRGLLTRRQKFLQGSWYIVKRKETARRFDLIRWRSIDDNR